MIVSLLVAMTLSTQAAERAESPRPLVIGVVMSCEIFKNDVFRFEADRPGAFPDTDCDYVLFPLAISEKKGLRPFYPEGEWDAHIATMAGIEARLSEQTAVASNRQYYAVGAKNRVFRPQTLVQCVAPLGSIVFGYRGPWTQSYRPKTPVVVCTSVLPSFIADRKAELPPKEGVLEAASVAMRQAEPEQRKSYQEWLGFDGTNGRTPVIKSIQGLDLPRKAFGAWIEVEKSFEPTKDSGQPFTSLYQAIYQERAGKWAPRWENTLLLGRGNPIYEPRHALLAVCDVNHDAVPEFVFQLTDMELSSVGIYSVSQNGLVEIARIPAPF